jgi:hypothetical protein
MAPSCRPESETRLPSRRPRAAAVASAMRKVVATITVDGRLRQAGDRYILSNQTAAAGGGGFGEQRSDAILNA